MSQNPALDACVRLIDKNAELITATLSDLRNHIGTMALCVTSSREKLVEMTEATHQIENLLFTIQQLAGDIHWNALTPAEQQDLIDEANQAAYDHQEALMSSGDWR